MSKSNDIKGLFTCKCGAPVKNRMVCDDCVRAGLIARNSPHFNSLMVAEAIEEGRPGFAGGWVSSRYLDALLDAIRAAVPRSKRRALMQSLGYDYHPALPDGRAAGIVTPDNARPRLYVRAGHLALNISSPVGVGDAYAKAQATGGQVVSGFSAPTKG